MSNPRNRLGLNAKWADLNTPARWRAWLDLAARKAPHVAEYWGDTDGCDDCIHLDSANAWCTTCEAPATRNPVLNTLGMACCGFGFEKQGQQESDEWP